MEYNFSETCMCLFWKFMIKAFFYSAFFCYDEIFLAETFLDLSLRWTCHAIRRKCCRWIKCKVRRHDFGFNFLAISLGGKCHFIEIKWTYSYLFNSLFYLLFWKQDNKHIYLWRAIAMFEKYVVGTLHGKFICQKILCWIFDQIFSKNQNEEWLIPNS